MILPAGRAFSLVNLTAPGPANDEVKAVLYGHRGDVESRLKELIKLAVWVERSVRRIVLHLPTSFPWLRTWRRIARAVGVTS